MFKYIEFNFEKKHLLILFFIIIRYAYSSILNFLIPNNKNDRFIVELNGFCGYLFFIFPYIYIKYSTRKINNKINQDKENSIDKRKKYKIKKKITNFSNFSKIYMLFIIGILYFFVYIVIYNFSFHLQKEKYYQLYYEFYPLSSLFLMKYFFNYKIYNFHYIYFISLIIFFVIRIIFCIIYYNDKCLYILLNLFIIFVERFVISFTMVLIQYLNQIVFINNYLIITFIGISSSICGILFFYLNSIKYYIINVACFICTFCIIIKFYLLLMIIDNFNALYIGLASCISITIEYSNFNNIFYYIYEISFIFFNMLALLIFCEIIIINVKGLNLKTIKNLENQSKKELCENDDKNKSNENYESELKNEIRKDEINNEIIQNI